MSFHASMEEGSMSIDGSVLKARLINVDGEAVDAELDLNDCLGNDNGVLVWEGGGFADSAENITLELEGADMVPILRCEVRNVDGEMVPTDKNLAERISNDNGALVFG